MSVYEKQPICLGQCNTPGTVCKGQMTCRVLSARTSEIPIVPICLLLPEETPSRNSSRCVQLRQDVVLWTLIFYPFKVPPSVITTAFSGRPHFARAFAARSSPRNDATAFICRALAPGENVGTCMGKVTVRFSTRHPAGMQTWLGVS